MKIQLSLMLACGVLLAAACKKDDKPEASVTVPVTKPKPEPGSERLKEGAIFPIGTAVEFNLLKTNAAYDHIVRTEFDHINTGNHFKHMFIVRDDGTFDFTTADQLYNYAKTAGLGVYGHTLVWHANTKGSYLRSLLNGGIASLGSDLISNGSFESGSGNSFDNWSTHVGGTVTGAITAVSTDVHEGNRAMKVVVSSTPSAAWDVQAINSVFTAQLNKQYHVTFYAKGSGGKIRAVSQADNYYDTKDATPTSEWTKYEWTVTPTVTAPQIKFHFPEMGTFYIDDVKVQEITGTTPLTQQEIKAKVENAMRTFITTMATHFKGKLIGWDVVNEVFSDTNREGLRKGPAPGEIPAQDIFYWGQYLDRDYIAKAFRWAHEADPDVDLYINDYNLEFLTYKVDTLVNFVKQLKAQNVPIHGIGTQMHMSTNTPKSRIDEMFIKLASTGLKVEVTELDISMNPSNNAGFIASPAVLDAQKDLYKYVTESYLKYVPAPQRAGMTIWGVGDADSWITVLFKKNDIPLLYDTSYQRKPAYYGLYEASRRK